MPRLLLYSADDELVGAADVESHIHALRAAGCGPLFTRRWERSPHVQHVRTDPAGYAAALDELLAAAAKQ